MSNLEPGVVVNRDEPIPAISTDGLDQERVTQQHDSPKDTSPARRLKKKISESKLKRSFDEKAASGTESSSIQDRMFSTLLRQFIPTEDPLDNGGKPDPRSRKYVARPNFSLPVMSSNFRRFNSRIGVVFVFQNRVIKLFSWKAPSHTLSFLAIYTFCCLNPYLLAVLPLALCLLFIMVPSFLSRHPPPPNTHSTETFSMRGPASALPPTVRPAPEMSKDFFRNMRDLKNCMGDFSVVHDKIISVMAPLTNFSDERVSSTIFFVVSALTGILFLASHVLPWRAIFLLLGWVTTCSTHPSAIALLATIDKEEIRSRERSIKTRLIGWMNEDIILDQAPELREVEVFELQKHQSGGNWESFVFSPSPYDPLTPSRISGDRPKGTRFFEDVQPPTGWDWGDKKWTLDLLARDWVEERMITAVEIETEGEHWVYDIGVSESSCADRPGTSPSESLRTNKRDWEEGTGLSLKGDWRRRRWVRLVKRKIAQAR
ncbi:MAG: hypothetical protein M1828_006534 [Chrysothrix sp. TS-e1954]|nr:MAG: hypothetical protein M1828_006534 [Chrysothrix sp. TS-e1954]